MEGHRLPRWRVGPRQQAPGVIFSTNLMFQCFSVLSHRAPPVEVTMPQAPGLHQNIIINGPVLLRHVIPGIFLFSDDVKTTIILIGKIGSVALKDRDFRKTPLKA